MKKYSLVYTILVFMAFGIFFADQVNAASNTLNFQSKIVNSSDGTNVVTGTPACVVAGSGNDTCDFRVNIYSASSAGTLYFSETHSNVEIGQYNGIFNLAINSVCTTSSGSSDGNWTNSGSSCVSNGGVDFSSSNLWIEIAFAPGGAGSFTETFSRVQIKDVASARYAVNSSYLGGYAYSDFVRFQPQSAQVASGGGSLINMESTTTTSVPLVVVNETGTGTPDLLRLQTASSTVFGVSNTGSLTMVGDLVNTSTGTVGLFNTNVTTLNIGGATTTLNLAGGVGSSGCTINASGDLSCLGSGTFTSTLDAGFTTFNLINTTATTINFGGAATTLNIGPGSTTATSINIAGGSGATGCTISGATGDLTCSGDMTATGGDLITTATTAALFNTGATVAVNIAGAAATTNLGGTTVNLAGGSASTGCTIDSSGNLACSGTIAIAADSLDYDDFEDTMDLDTNLTVNQATASWNQNFTGTNTAGYLYSANSLTSGAGLYLSSTSTAFTGNLQRIILSGNNAANTGNLLELSILGASSAATGLKINNVGTGPAIWSAAGDNRFDGALTTGLTTIDVFNTTATTINLGGAATTLNIGPGSTTATNVNIAGGSGATGCTVAGATGNLTCSGTISGTFSIAADSLDFIDFEDTMDLDASINVQQSTNSWTQLYNGTGSFGYSYVASNLTTGSAMIIGGSSLTSGQMLGVSTTSGLFTGNLISAQANANTANNTGNLVYLAVGGASSLVQGLYMSNLGVGNSIKIEDSSSDTTPFTIDASGNVSVGGNINTSLASIDLLNTTATTINFGGAATTALNIGPGSTTATNVNIAGGSGATGCTVAGATGNLTCSGTISGTFSMAADSLDYIDFQDTLDLDNNLTLNQGSFTWAQTFTGTTTVGKTYTANSLTSGTGIAIASTATGLTGNLQTISLTGNSGSNTGDLLELSITGTSTAARGLYISNLGIGDSIRILDDPSDGTPFVVDQHGNVTTGGHIDTWLSTIGLLATPTSITFGAAATSMNIGAGGATATTLLFAGGSAATGCSMTGNDGAFSCTSTVAGGGFSTGGNLTVSGTAGIGVANITGALTSNSLSTGGITATGLVNTGNGAVDYTPTALNWGSTGSTILLNALNYSTISFHDSGSRVDFIRVGAGVITLGYDGGYGNAGVAMPGTVSIGNSTLTEKLNVGLTYGGAQAFVASFFHDGNNANADGILVQGGQDDGLSTTIYFQARDGDGTNVGRLANVAGTFALADQSDRRTKTNIVDTGIQGLSTLNALRVVDYNRIQAPNGPTIHGFIAQEVQEVYPFAVFDEDDQGMLSLSKELMIPMIVKATQELYDIVESNTGTIDDLRIRDTELLALINSLESRVAGVETRVTALEGAQSGSGAAVDLVNFMATNGSFSGNLNVNGKIYMGNENVGEAKILAGDTEVTIAFDTDFETMPIIQVTPQSDNFLTLPVKYVVSEKGVDKFKIKIDVAQLEDLVFNWSVTGTRDGVQIDSDGNVANL